MEALCDLHCHLLAPQTVARTQRPSSDDTAGGSVPWPAHAPSFHSGSCMCHICLSGEEEKVVLCAMLSSQKLRLCRIKHSVIPPNVDLSLMPVFWLDQFMITVHIYVLAYMIATFHLVSTGFRSWSRYHIDYREKCSSFFSITCVWSPCHWLACCLTLGSSPPPPSLESPRSGRSGACSVWLSWCWAPTPALPPAGTEWWPFLPEARTTGGSSPATP